MPDRPKDLAAENAALRRTLRAEVAQRKRLQKEFGQETARRGTAEAMLAETQSHERAASDILRVISGSPTATQPVFDAIAERALRLCEGAQSAVLTFDGKLVHLVALANVNPAGSDALRLIAIALRLCGADSSAKNLGYALGTAEYLVKPLDRDRLVDVIRRHRPGRPILVVDDEAEQRRLLRRILEHEGYAVVEADNGHAALDRLREGTPAVILLDLMMPVMDGFEFLVERDREQAWRGIPVIVLTARDLSADDRERLRGSVARVLQKGAHAREALLAEVPALVAASMGRRAGR
jgi:CheY-like chemotaxis protein